MKNLIKEISYLKGFFEASNLDEKSKESIIFSKMINIIEVMGEKIIELEETKVVFDDFLESINEYSEQVMNEQNTDAYNIKDEIGNDFIDNNTWSDLECKNCNEVVYIKEEDLYSANDIICPSCNEIILSNSEE